MLTVYKLFRLKNGKLFPLFINRKVETKIGEWLTAECFPTKGYAVRQGWHCTLWPKAPHLKLKLANGEQRVWSNATLSTGQRTTGRRAKAGRGFSPKGYE